MSNSSDVDVDTFIQTITKGRAIQLNGILMQLGITSAVAVSIIIGFSIVRPRHSKIYAPKNKYSKPAGSEDYEPPPPRLSNGFFAWLSPVVHLHEKQMIINIGLDAVTFLRFARMIAYLLVVCSLYGIVLFAVSLAFNLQVLDKDSLARIRKEDPLSMFTLANVTGSWMWPALGFTYVITFTVMYFVWRNWQAMIILRQDWFRSPQYQHKIYSRTLMVTNVPREYRSDQGLVHLMQQLKVDGIKIAQEIDCTAIGRCLHDFPTLIDHHNEAVMDLEKVLVKYLRHGKIASKRPMIRKNGFMCCGGRKVDAIDYYAKQIKFLRDQVDERRAKINSLIREERRARKGGRASRVEGETYGFVTFKTVAQAHRINQSHGGKTRELSGARIQLAPDPKDILWQNISKNRAEVQSARMLGWFLLGGLCIAYAVPTALISFLANLGSFANMGENQSAFAWLTSWRNSSPWSFNLISSTLGPLVQVIFLFFLPIIIRRICKYQGTPTRSRLDRATTARYYFITTIWTLFFLSVLSVVYSTVQMLIVKINNHQSFGQILDDLSTYLPDQIRVAYVSQSNYWLTWLPLRGLLVIYDLIQLLKLALVSFRRLMFHYTPRDIRELTKPYLFDYHVVSVNLLFVATVALVYAPIAPMVVFGATLVMWFSYIVYKYQLLYVYVSRSESGGRMWNVYVNRLIAATFFMQFLMILTTGLIRHRALDAIAGAPPVLILIAFKVWMSYTAEPRFRFYRPTPDEAESQRIAAMGEKPTSPSDMERKFLHPALRSSRVYTIMVHENQEDLARQVLSDYPWFTEKSQGTQIRGVREENLEYNPDHDAATEADAWETRSVASTDMLSNFGDNASVFAPSPMVSHATLPKLAHSHSFTHHINGSTDELLASPAPLGYARQLPAATSSAETLLPGYPPYAGVGAPGGPGGMYHTPMYRTESGGSEQQDAPWLYGGGVGAPMRTQSPSSVASPSPGMGTYPPERRPPGYPYQ